MEETKLNVNMSVNSQVYDTENFEYDTHLAIINLDEECQYDISHGKGFFVEEPQSIKKDLKSENSIFSSKFGCLDGDDDMFVDRYRCECGAKRGRINHNTECQICHTLVKYVDDDFEYFGWICLKDKYFIIHPNLYKCIDELLGGRGTRLLSIIEGDEEKDENGFTKVPDDKKNELYVKKSQKYKDEPYYQIGMIKFKEKFDEIMQYYVNKFPTKRKYYDHIMQYRDCVFAHSIPVYTALLRPTRKEGDNLIFEATNAIYNMMAKLVGQANSDSIELMNKIKMKKLTLYQIQMKYMELYKEIENILSQKKGIVRNLIGGRYNFTSRSIIVSDPMLRIDQIKLSYHLLVKVMQQTIINILKKSYNISMSKAYDWWFNATLNIDPRVEDIINNLIKATPNGIPFIINRNPSINYGSLLQMYCIGITHDYTMKIPLQILPPLAADFDGDCLNIWYLINKEYIARCERSFNPRNAMYISNNDGMFNNNLNHARDLLINMNSFIHYSRDAYTPEELKTLQAYAS